MHSAVLLLWCALAADDSVRYSVSLTEEASAASGLRVSGPDAGNVVLLQPSLSYKHGDRWTFSSTITGFLDTQGDTHSQLRVRETYVGISAGDVDFTVGKRLLRWGTGYAFTATGVLDPPRAATDPTDRLSLNEGREMVKADWIKGSHDLTVVWAAAGLPGENRTGRYDTTAVRYNVLAHGWDTSLIVAHDGGRSTFTGANFTRVFGDALEAHGEFAWREGAALLLGGKYTLSSGVSFIAEFYAPPNTSYYRPAAMPAAVGRQHYGFVRAGKSRLRELPGWKEWDVSASLVANLDDHSRVGVLDLSRRVGNHLSLYGHLQTPGGNRLRSQYGMVPYSALLSAGIRVQI